MDIGESDLSGTGENADDRLRFIDELLILQPSLVHVDYGELEDVVCVLQDRYSHLETLL